MIKKNKTLLIIVTLISIFLSIPLVSQAKTTKKGSPSVFKSTEFKAFDLKPEEVLKKYGKTVNGESTLSDVYKKQDKTFFSLEYKDITFYYFANGKLDQVDISSSKHPVFRDIKVGMSVRELLKKFPCTNASVLKYLKNDKTSLADLRYEDLGYGTLQLDLYSTKSAHSSGIIRKTVEDKVNKYEIAYFDFSTDDDFFQGVWFDTKNDKISNIGLSFIIEND